LTLGDLLLGLCLQRAVDDAEQRVVLPEAHAECDRHRRQAHDEPSPQLVEVTDDTERVAWASGRRSALVAMAAVVS
jgi:hypothetical protein